jgi:hypothetical protein
MLGRKLAGRGSRSARPFSRRAALSTFVLAHFFENLPSRFERAINALDQRLGAFNGPVAHV